MAEAVPPVEEAGRARRLDEASDRTAPAGSDSPIPSSKQPEGNGIHEHRTSPYLQQAPDNAFGYMPPGMDRDAYIAGERAAMARALQLTLPSQQTLGMLAGGLQRLEHRLDEEAAHNRALQMSSSEVKAVAQAVQQRLEHLELLKLPGMEEKIQRALDAPLSQEFQATLSGLQSALHTVAAQRMLPPSPYSLTGFALRQLTWLGATASGYAQQALTKADVAAVFLSRKILLDQGSLSGMRRLEQGESGIDVGVDAPSTTGRSMRSAAGALVFLAAVEAAWQLHGRAAGYIPKPMRRATAPAQLGLRILRGATWAALLTLSAVHFRRGCYVAADQSISSINRCLNRYITYRPFCGPVIQAPLPPGSSPDEPVRIQAEYADSLVIEEDGEEGPPSATPPPKPQRQRSIFDTPPPSPFEGIKPEQ